MTAEVKMIPVTAYAYRTPNGTPTCARDFGDGKVCNFLTTRKNGFVEVCGYLGRDLERENKTGWIYPLLGCPVWSKT